MFLHVHAYKNIRVEMIHQNHKRKAHCNQEFKITTEIFFNKNPSNWAMNLATKQYIHIQARNRRAPQGKVWVLFGNLTPEV